MHKYVHKWQLSVPYEQAQKAKIRPAVRENGMEKLASWKPYSTWSTSASSRFAIKFAIDVSVWSPGCNQASQGTSESSIDLIKEALFFHLQRWHPVCNGFLGHR